MLYPTNVCLTQSTMVAECSLSTEAQLHVSRIGFRPQGVTEDEQHNTVYFSDVDFLDDVRYKWGRAGTEIWRC